MVKILGDRGNLQCQSPILAERVCLDVSGSPLHIGHDVDIRHDVTIYTHSHPFHLANWRTLPKLTTPTPTVIADYAFIGIKAIILHTCKYIGRHSVIGAGSVVTQDVPDYQIWAGNPARQVGMVYATMGTDQMEVATCP